MRPTDDTAPDPLPPFAPEPEEDTATESLWRSRLLWRLRGATMWPAFAAVTVLGGIVLAVIPFAGSGPGFVGGLLLTGFLGLLVVAVLAPLTGRLLRRRRPGLPRDVATDVAGTGLLVALLAVLVVGGLNHRGALAEEESDFAMQSAAVRQFVATQAPPEYARNIDDADTWQQGPDLFRTCVPGADPRKALCLIVTTEQHPPGITVDSDQQPNSRISGPLNPGRQGG